MTIPTPGSDDTQLAGRVREMLPNLTGDDRLKLLNVMDEGDMRTSLAWLISYAPQLFDFALVRDRKMTGRLQGRLDEVILDEDDLEPYCTACGGPVGIFMGHGDAWLHYAGEGTVASPVELRDAGHAPAVAWREAGAR